MIGDGDAMGGTADIGIDLLGSSKRFFGIDDPFLPFEFLEKA